MFDPKMFIHIPKCAGMTIRRSDALLGKIIPATPQTHKSPEYTKALEAQMKKQGDHHGHDHARWRDLDWKFQAYDCFAVARNPWDRVVSRYFFARKVKYVEKKADGQATNCDTFEQFLEERHVWGDVPYNWHRAIKGWYPAVDHTCDEKGDLKCDIIRFENLNKDLEKYFNIPQMTQARNVTGLNEGTYMDMYTEKTIQIVADWYKADIDLWGYDFDTGAQRNYWNGGMKR